MQKYYLILVVLLWGSSIKSMEDSDDAHPLSPQELEHIQNVIRARALQSPNWGKPVITAPPGVTPIHAWQLPTPIPLIAQVNTAPEESNAPAPATASPVIATFPQVIMLTPATNKRPASIRPIRRSARLQDKKQKIKKADIFEGEIR